MKKGGNIVTKVTLEVFLRAETCVREPLNSSHSKQPNPHISADLFTSQVEHEVSQKINSLPFLSLP